MGLWRVRRRGEPVGSERLGEGEPDRLGPYVEGRGGPVQRMAPHGRLRLDDGVGVVAEDLRDFRVDRDAALIGARSRRSRTLPSSRPRPLGVRRPRSMSR